MEHTRDIYTPEQAASYLQVNRETIYRYIRQGKLAASRLGRSYRILHRSLELLLWTTRSRPDISLREYTSEEIEKFLREDELDAEARAIVRRLAAPSSAHSKE